MADTTTLNPFSQPKVENGARKQVVGLFGDTFEALGDLVGNQILGQENTPPSFEANEPVRTPVPEDFRNAFSEQTTSKLSIGGQTEIPFNNAEQIQYQEALRRIKHFETINAQVEQAAKASEVLQQSTQEVMGMSDEGLAHVSKYNNEDYRGENLRSRHNLLEAIFNLFQERLNAMKEKMTPVQIFSRRTSTKAAVSGANDLLLNATAPEGQSMTSSSGAVRGAG